MATQAPPPDTGTQPAAAPAATPAAAPAEAPAAAEPTAALGVEESDEGLVGDFSLADLAGLDVSAIEEIRSERLPAMAGVFRGNAVELQDGENRDGERRFIAVCTFEVAEVHTVVEKGFTPAELIGKKHTERFYIVPEKAHEGIGRIRGFVSDVGLNSAGALGGVEGMPPGILDSLVGHAFPAKITTRKVEGETFSRLKLPARKKPTA